MSRWKRVIRGVLGMGLTFGAIGAALFSLVALASALFFPGAEDELGFMIIAGAVWGAGIGTSFSAILAIAARGRSLDELSPTHGSPRWACWAASCWQDSSWAAVGGTGPTGAPSSRSAFCHSLVREAAWPACWSPARPGARCGQVRRRGRSWKDEELDARP